MADYCIMIPDGDILTCKGCNRTLKKWVGLPENVVRTCKGVTGRRSVVTSWKQHRPRTPEEIKATHPICRACPHYLSEPTETLDAGVCLLRAKGCGACKSLEQFARYIADGHPCPDKPRRFEGTPLAEISKTDAR